MNIIKHYLLLVLAVTSFHHYANADDSSFDQSQLLLRKLLVDNILGSPDSMADRHIASLAEVLSSINCLYAADNSTLDVQSIKSLCSIINSAAAYSNKSMRMRGQYTQKYDIVAQLIALSKYVLEQHLSSELIQMIAESMIHCSQALVTYVVECSASPEFVGLLHSIVAIINTLGLHSGLTTQSCAFLADSCIAIIKCCGVMKQQSAIAELFPLIINITKVLFAKEFVASYRKLLNIIIQELAVVSDIASNATVDMHICLTLIESNIRLINDQYALDRFDSSVIPNIFLAMDNAVDAMLVVVKNNQCRSVHMGNIITQIDYLTQLCDALSNSLDNSIIHEHLCVFVQKLMHLLIALHHHKECSTHICENTMQFLYLTMRSLERNIVDNVQSVDSITQNLGCLQDCASVINSMDNNDISCDQAITSINLGLLIIKKLLASDDNTADTVAIAIQAIGSLMETIIKSSLQHKTVDEIKELILSVIQSLMTIIQTHELSNESKENVMSIIIRCIDCGKDLEGNDARIVGEVHTMLNEFYKHNQTTVDLHILADSFVHYCTIIKQHHAIDYLEKALQFINNVIEHDQADATSLYASLNGIASASSYVAYLAKDGRHNELCLQLIRHIYAILNRAAVKKHCVGQNNAIILVSVQYISQALGFLLDNQGVSGQDALENQNHLFAVIELCIKHCRSKNEIFLAAMSCVSLLCANACRIADDYALIAPINMYGALILSHYASITVDKNTIKQLRKIFFSIMRATRCLYIAKPDSALISHLVLYCQAIIRVTQQARRKRLRNDDLFWFDHYQCVREILQHVINNNNTIQNTQDIGLLVYFIVTDQLSNSVGEKIITTYLAHALLVKDLIAVLAAKQNVKPLLEDALEVVDEFMKKHDSIPSVENKLRIIAAIKSYASSYLYLFESVTHRVLRLYQYR